jgi:hypothetical protein
VLLQLGSKPVPKDHPHASLLAGSTTGGETRFGPDLVSEINRRVKATELLDSEHIEFLRAELVTCFAGSLSETKLLGQASDVGRLADLKQAAVVFNMLGWSHDADGGSARLQRAGDLAEKILRDLAEGLKRVATKLSEGGPIELDELAAHSSLEEAGIESGSYRDLLDALAE